MQVEHREDWCKSQENERRRKFKKRFLWYLITSVVQIQAHQLTIVIYIYIHIQLQHLQCYKTPLDNIKR